MWGVNPSRNPTPAFGSVLNLCGSKRCILFLIFPVVERLPTPVSVPKGESQAAPRFRRIGSQTLRQRLL